MRHRKHPVGQVVLAHHEPDSRQPIVDAHQRVVVLMAEHLWDFIDLGILNSVDYLLVRPAPNVQFDTGLSAEGWWTAAKRQTKDSDGNRNIVIAGQMAAARGKKIGLLGPVEYWTDSEVNRAAFGDFEASRARLLAQAEGLWAIVGNTPTGNIDQAWWDTFNTPALDACFREGLAADGENEYGYAWPGALVKPWLAQEDGMVPSHAPTMPPVPVGDMDNPIEAWMIGRFQWTIDRPGYVPVFIPETGCDVITPEQVEEWGAPYQRLEDGTPVPFSGINSLQYRIDDFFDAAPAEGAAYYGKQYLNWIGDFYSQFENFYGAAAFGVGPHYTQPGKDRAQFEDYDLGKSGADAVHRAEIMASGWTDKVLAWDWAAHYLGTSPDPDPTPVPVPAGDGTLVGDMEILAIASADVAEGIEIVVSEVQAASQQASDAMDALAAAGTEATGLRGLANDLAARGASILERLREIGDEVD